MKRQVFSALTLAVLAGAAQATGAVAKPAAKASKPLSGGIAMQYVERSVRPQDDLFQHVNGKWLKSVEIPADKSTWGSMQQLRDLSQAQVRALIDKVMAAQAAPGTDEQRIADFYASFMDEERLEQLGAAPLAGELARIAAIKDKAELPALIAHMNKLGVNMPYDFMIHQDAKEPTRYVADLFQNGLGMPDRDYYLKLDDARLSEARAGYRAHMEKMLALAGDKDAAANAQAVMELETALARIQWNKSELRDPLKTYNKIDIDKLGEMAPGWDWKAYLDALGVTGKTSYVLVTQPSYLKGLPAIAASTPLETWKAYMRMHLVDAYAPLLSKAFAQEYFNFYGKALKGQKEMEPRWKRGVVALENALGFAIGRLYVAQHFPPERKARMEKMVANLMTAMKQSIDTLEWMGPETRREAQAKLSKFKAKIGYPNAWKDYSALEIRRGDLVGNTMRSRQLENNRELDKLGKPLDRDEWFMPPQTVNAYYNWELNEVVFPAAMLQAPFFDANADDAVNYGAIGAVIGHEISHGFDDMGSQYDGDGNLRNWWTPEDRKNFSARTQMLVEQYNRYSPLAGYHVDGAMTLGENIADNSGLAIAHKAYKLSLGGTKAPVIGGLTGDQRFYMGWAQVWRAKMREQQQIMQVKSDYHAPAMFRANGTVKNLPGFYEAFGVKPGDKMYVEPKDRVTIW